MKPRPVIADACVLVTRRCFARQFILRPDDEAVGIFACAIAMASQKYGIRVLGAVQMSNHYHMVVHDPEGNLPEFLGWFHADLTRRMNALRGRADTIWETRQTSCVELGDAEAVLDALAYIHLNPVAAGLVGCPGEWPGMLTGPEELRQDAKTVRPLFRSKGAKTEGCTELVVHVPPTHEHLSRAEFADLLRTRIDRLLAWIHHGMARIGRSFGTAREVVETPWDSVPRGAAPGADPDEAHEGLFDMALAHRIHEPDMPLPLDRGVEGEETPPPDIEGRVRQAGGDINPTVKASSAQRRRGLLERLAAFREAYAKALQRLRDGLQATFPGGTYKLARLLRYLQVEAAPLPAWRLC